jgi:glyoxylase-like metal-dependent hydrolase (beta-lactamase superfamily II)
MSFDEALARADLKPDDISLVILTHLMYDHCANAKLLPNARFVVQKEELKYAENPHPLFAGAYDSALFDGLDFEVIEGDRQFMPGIDLIHTPGHSPGCQSVAVKTTAGTAVITGFCCVMSNFEPDTGSAWVSERTPEVIPPGIHLDMREAYASAKRVKDIADIIVPMHDPLLLTKHQIPD